MKRVVSKARIQSLYFQKNVLEPIFKKEIPDVYEKDIVKIWLYKDKASSHMRKSTVAYLANKETETEINCIPFTKIPVK